MQKRVSSLFALLFLVVACSTTFSESKAVGGYEYCKLFITEISYENDDGKTVNFTSTVILSRRDNIELASSNNDKAIKIYESKSPLIEKTNRDFYKLYSGQSYQGENMTKVDILNQLGADGWEIIHTDYTPWKTPLKEHPQEIYLFKRKLK